MSSRDHDIDNLSARLRAPAAPPPGVDVARRDARIAAEIEAVVERETRVWNTQDVELLLSVFHPDMAWPFPPDADAHDPPPGSG